ncbi:hypothetical protein K523DRAFT_19561 [Schizophyllum commune Tattone D]|nr:hypothetical protein K523DRAFT_19561 [Schizophyllum commune Tattone D]
MILFTTYVHTFIRPYAFLCRAWLADILFDLVVLYAAPMPVHTSFTPMFGIYRFLSSYLACSSGHFHAQLNQIPYLFASVRCLRRSVSRG